MTAFATSVLTTLLVACTSGGGHSAAPPLFGSPQKVMPTAVYGLRSALDLVPDIPDGYAQYTNWSRLGHPTANDPNIPAFAGELRTDDLQLQQDLGIRSTGADWEVDVSHPRVPAMVVLHYSSDLSGLPRKLTAFGYRRNGPLLIRPLGGTHMWTYTFQNLGIDPRRHLLIGGQDATMVRTVLTGPSHPLSHDEALEPLLTSAQSQLGDVATAATAIGGSACLPLVNAIGKNVSPVVLMNVRKRLPGTFTRPQAELTALAHATDTTAIDALTFPRQSLATANEPSRAGSIRFFSGLQDGNPGEIQVAGSTVTGRILTFDLRAQQSRDFMPIVRNGTLGADVCP